MIFGGFTRTLVNKWTLKSSHRLKKQTNKLGDGGKDTGAAAPPELQLDHGCCLPFFFLAPLLLYTRRPACKIKVLIIILLIINHCFNIAQFQTPPPPIFNFRSHEAVARLIVQINSESSTFSPVCSTPHGKRNACFWANTRQSGMFNEGGG